MRILLTGGAGTLGSNLLERYLPFGNEIYVVDNFATGSVESLPIHPNLKVKEGDVSNFSDMEKVFKEFQPTHIIHSAAAYKDPLNWEEDTKTNVIGSVNVAKLSERYAVKKIINFQTALCYGRPQQVPIPRTHPLGPFTSYGISKTAGEAYFLHSGLPVISLRLANICGPRLSIGPIPTFYTRLKAEKKCFCSDTTRDFMDISDFFEIMDLALNENSPNGVFNVSTGVGHTIFDVFNEVAGYLGIEVPDVPIVPPGADDVPVVVLDPTETELTFGWKAKNDFSTTIRNQLQWYDKYGVGHIYSHLQAPK